MRRLVLFAREPVPGRVKTRLAARLGAERACRLYEAMLEDLAGQLTPGEGFEPVLAHADPQAGPALRRIFASPWRLVPQGDGDLGARLARAFSDAAADGASATVVAGSDAPTLTCARVGEAFDELAGGVALCVAPSPDGGYALLGLAGHVRPGPLLAGVRWSTGSTLADTLASARRLGLAVALLPPVPDVDSEEDVLPVCRLLAESGSGIRTRAVASELGAA